MSFSDKRLNSRLLKIVSKLSASPESKLSESFGNIVLLLGDFCG
jgi:hypothetical protein